MRQVALSDRSGRAEFTFVPENPWLSGFVSTAGASYERESIKVDVMTLAEAMPEAPRVDVLKVDVEGAELQVFLGARAVLERSRPVVFFEHQRLRWDKGGVLGLGEADYESNANLFALLADDLDYRLFDLDGVGPLTADQFRQYYETGERFNFLGSP